jgi:hypothetical protein
VHRRDQVFALKRELGGYVRRLAAPAERRPDTAERQRGGAEGDGVLARDV